MKVQLVDTIIEVNDIRSISDILKPRTDKFNDDCEFSNDDEREWTHRFVVTFTDYKTIIITEYDVKIGTLKTVHQTLLDHWSGHQPSIPVIGEKAYL